MIDEDMAQFARMGWDGLRLTFWGDWEASDTRGQPDRQRPPGPAGLPHRPGARTRHLHAVQPHPALRRELARRARRHDLARLRPALRPGEHGHRPRRDRRPGELSAPDPAITSIPIPAWRSRTSRRSSSSSWSTSRCIIRRTSPARSATSILSPTPCAAPAAASSIFYNVSQDFRIGEAIRRSKAQGVTLRLVSDRAQLGPRAAGQLPARRRRLPRHAAPRARPAAAHRLRVRQSRLAQRGTMYPAMARSFRAVGAQFAAMFAYDMLATASRNLGWQTHYLNLVYTPRKAMSADHRGRGDASAAEDAVVRPVSAEHAVRRFPRLGRRGSRRAGRARCLPLCGIDARTPPDPAALSRIAGYRLVVHRDVRGRGDLLPRQGARGPVAARGVSRRGAGPRSIRAS